MASLAFRTEIVREPTMTKLHHAYVEPGEHSVDDSFRYVEIYVVNEA